MNDKQQLAAMGEHMAEQTEQTKQEAQPLCMAKRIEELEAQVRVMAGLLREAVAWMDDHPAMPDSSIMHDALAGKLPAPAAPEGWQLVPREVVSPTLSWPLDVGASAFERAKAAGCVLEDCIHDAVSAMLAAAPKPEAK